MRRRVFVALHLSPNVRREIQASLDGITQTLAPLTSIRYRESSNWHLTLSFLGLQSDESIATIAETLRNIAAETPCPEIVCTMIEYASHDRGGGFSHMIWARTDAATSRSLGRLARSFEDRLEAQEVRFRRNTRAFTGHITLAKFSSHIQPLPSLRAALSHAYRVHTLDLMESTLSRHGAIYTVLAKEKCMI